MPAQTVPVEHMDASQDSILPVGITEHNQSAEITPGDTSMDTIGELPERDLLELIPQQKCAIAEPCPRTRPTRTRKEPIWMQDYTPK